MLKINIYIINFFYYCNIVYNFMITLFLSDSYFTKPELHNCPVVIAVSQSGNTDITNRFIYMTILANYSSKIMQIWVNIYCVLWLKDKIMYNDVEYIDNFPFSVIELE